MPSNGEDLEEHLRRVYSVDFNNHRVPDHSPRSTSIGSILDASWTTTTSGTLSISNYNSHINNISEGTTMPENCETPKRKTRKKAEEISVFSPCAFNEDIKGRVINNGKVVESMISLKSFNSSMGTFDLYCGKDKLNKDIYVNDVIEHSGQLYHIQFSFERGTYGVALSPDGYFVWIVCFEINSGTHVTDIYNYKEFISKFTIPDDIVKKIKTIEI